MFEPIIIPQVEKPGTPLTNLFVELMAEALETTPQAARKILNIPNEKE